MIHAPFPSRFLSVVLTTPSLLSYFQRRLGFKHSWSMSLPEPSTTRKRGVVRNKKRKVEQPRKASETQQLGFAKMLQLSGFPDSALPPCQRAPVELTPFHEERAKDTHSPATSSGWNERAGQTAGYRFRGRHRGRLVRGNQA